MLKAEAGAETLALRGRHCRAGTGFDDSSNERTEGKEEMN